MPGVPEEQIVVEGRSRIIAFAVLPNGEMPVRKFLECEGKPKDIPSKQELRQLKQMFDVLSSTGRLNKEKLKHLTDTDGLYEFRANETRIATFSIGRVWYLLLAIKKKRGDWPKHKLDLARDMKKQCIEAMRGNDDAK